MKVFIAGIGGAFMGGIAQLAKASGYTVRGCDAAVYPPMSTTLQSQHIEVLPGYSPEHLGADPGLVLIGNALSRGNPLVERVLDQGLAFQSGPEWLRQRVLAARSPIAVAGTHGKTSAACMLAWLLECAGQSPGYLIGGKPGNFARSARLGNGEWFVIEADEYDTAFFDKRAKFVHYRPRIVILNNLEFDHADIYDNLEQIQKQFHHLLRTVPSNGVVVHNADDQRLAEVIDLGCWSRITRFAIGNAEAEWRATPVAADCSRFDVSRHGRAVARVNWGCIGAHNMQNALAALAAADLAGVPPASAAEYLRGFKAAERRMQLVFQSAGCRLYDDFAHHPTAIAATIAAARARHPGSRVLAVVELRSNTMRLSAKNGGHGQALVESLQRADCAMVCGAAEAAPPNSAAKPGRGEILHLRQADEIISALQSKLSGNDVILTMSNGSFGGLAGKIAASISSSQPD